MCGIAGVFNYSRSPNLVSEDILKRMTRVIAHRGPDDDGIYINPEQTLGFGFRRLAIIDLSPAGHQPMSNHDGSIWLVFNGEIYNHLSLRKDLEAKGYRYRSRSDTETIIYAYEEYGIDFIEKLYGMFAIALWDSRKAELLLIRDRIGVKPLYYAVAGGAFIFGSEIKAILEHPAVSRQLNEQALYDYLTLYAPPPNETAFKGVFKLEAGHFAIINRCGEMKKTQWWELNHRTETFPKDAFASEAFCVENVRRLLRDSIKLRMMSDVPFGVMLSGGIDSSLNVALMSELMTRPVETFSVGFKDLEKYNELGYARRIASLFKTNHHEVLLSEQDAIDFLPEMVWLQDEPNADPVCVPLYFVSKLCRDSGTIVAQVGEGSDELFSGYAQYLRELWFHDYYDLLLPDALKALFYAVLRRVQPLSLLSDYARRSLTGEPTFYGGAVAFTEEQKAALCASRFLHDSLSSSRIAARAFKRFEAIASPSESADFLRKMIFAEFKHRLPELLLMRVDKMSMAVSIEARVPFLDHRLVEFAIQIPRSLKVKNGVPKYVLKKAAEGIIPNDIIYRRKQGFAAPAVEWLRSGKLSRVAEDAILSSGLMKRDLFRKKFIKRLLNEHRSAKRNHGQLIWTLLVASLWHDRFFGK
ncbi:MAG: asparagine synthase (glutamine-hydrolyzing) [Chloroherpetonaceae bacterium]|nr:asparagine synthase (glutamine-hydrolyzing) [Chloroherpetonaceae bacterium]MDW8438467.1 asparagine synthase (glutamine-hydrolyzing) [Chloroherpetonaceae bacterium]